MKFHGIGETCFQIYHSLPTDELKQLFGSTCKLAHDEKVTKGFQVVEAQQLGTSLLKRQQKAQSMNEKKAANKVMSAAEHQARTQDVREQMVAETAFTPHRGRDEKVAQNNRQAHKHQKERKKEQRNCSLE